MRIWYSQNRKEWIEIYIYAHCLRVQKYVWLILLCNRNIKYFENTRISDPNQTTILFFSSIMIFFAGNYRDNWPCLLYFSILIKIAKILLILPSEGEPKIPWSERPPVNLQLTNSSCKEPLCLPLKMSMSCAKWYEKNTTVRYYPNKWKIFYLARLFLTTSANWIT